MNCLVSPLHDYAHWQGKLSILALNLDDDIEVPMMQGKAFNMFCASSVLSEPLTRVVFRDNLSK